MSTKGFTLLELVVVVAVLTLGAAILLPRGLEARLLANETSARETLSMFASSHQAWLRLGATPTGFQSYAAAPLRPGEDVAVLRQALMPIWVFASSGRQLSHQGYAYTLIESDGALSACEAHPTSPGFSGRESYRIDFLNLAEVESLPLVIAGE